MPATITALVDDLKALRTGLGVEDPHLVTRAGVTIRRLSGVTDDDSPGIVREKIRNWLSRMIGQLPDATARIGRAAFGIDGPGDLSYLARLENLGRIVDREVRTMQRRADHMVGRIAELAAVHPRGTATAEPLDAPEQPPGQPWHSAQVRVDLILDQPEIEVFENRRIVSHVDGLAEITHWLSVPPVEHPRHPLDLADLGITLLGGGDMRTRPRMLSSSRVELVLHPPSPLDTGEHHEFFFRVRVPTLLPFYVCTPRFACDEFQLRVRFGRDRIPGRIWLIDGELPMEAADPVPVRPTLRADNAGEVHVKFADLVPASSYGIGWQPG